MVKKKYLPLHFYVVGIFHDHLQLFRYPNATTADPLDPGHGKTLKHGHLMGVLYVHWYFPPVAHCGLIQFVFQFDVQ